MAALVESSPNEEASLPDDAASANLAWPPKRRRLATVYDAVAGKVTYDQALRDADNETGDELQGSHAAASTNTAQSSGNNPTPYPPEEVLFRRRNAPERYAEHDVYFANERELPSAGQGTLPDSDLLTAVHGYASRFYDAVAKREVHVGDPSDPAVDERSMDETALLAFGILMEEAGREVLGRRGDLVFTEDGDASDDDDLTDQALQNLQDRPRSSSASRAKRRRLTTPADER